MRTPVIAVSTAVLMLAALSGCGSKTPSGTSGLTGVTATSTPSTPPPSGGGTPTSGTTTGATPTPTKTGGTTTTTITYRKDDRGYATDALNAYVRGNQTLLKAFVDSSALSNFANLGHPNTHWHFHKCDADGANRACTFDNENGDRLSIDVKPTLLGAPHAVVSTFIDRTQIDDSADGMVSGFIQAWFDGNTYRMSRLASSSVTSQVMRDFPTPRGQMLSDDTTTQPGYTIVSVYFNVDGGTLLMEVKDSNLGKAHGLKLRAS
jgi:hypothetical protein